MAPNQDVPSPAASELEAPAAGSLGAPASSASAGEGEQPAHASEAEQALPANSAPGPAQGLDLAEYAPARGTITPGRNPYRQPWRCLAAPDGRPGPGRCPGVGYPAPGPGRPERTHRS